MQVFCGGGSVYFLLQIIEQFRRKEVNNGYAETVTQLFYGRYGSAVVTPTDNVIDCGLCYTAYIAKFVY